MKEKTSSIGKMSVFWRGINIVPYNWRWLQQTIIRILANDNWRFSNVEKTAVMIFYEDRPYAHMDILGIHKGNLRLSTCLGFNLKIDFDNANTKYLSWYHITILGISFTFFILIVTKNTLIHHSLKLIWIKFKKNLSIDLKWK